MTTMPLRPMFPSLAFTANDALAAALAQVPGFLEHEQAGAHIHEALSTVSTTLQAAMTTQQALTERILDAARTGSPMPKTLAKDAADAARAVTDASAAVALVREADVAVRTTADRVLADAPDAILSHLERQLEDTLTQARTLGLEGVHSPQEAIDADLVQEWQDYQTLTSRYEQIRAAQSVVLVHLLHSNVALSNQETFALVRNYAEVFPQWLAARRRIPISDYNGEPVYDTAPWDESTPTGLWHHAVRHDEVDLWVPTQGELQQAITKAANDARDLDNARMREDAGRPLSDLDKQLLANARRLERGAYVTDTGVHDPDRLVTVSTR